MDRPTDVHLPLPIVSFNTFGLPQLKVYFSPLLFLVSSVLIMTLIGLLAQTHENLSPAFAFFWALLLFYGSRRSKPLCHCLPPKQNIMRSTPSSPGYAIFSLISSFLIRKLPLFPVIIRPLATLQPTLSSTSVRSISSWTAIWFMISFNWFDSTAHIPTTLQLVDIFTKALPSYVLHAHLSKMGIIDIYSPSCSRY